MMFAQVRREPRRQLRTLASQVPLEYVLRDGRLDRAVIARFDPRRNRADRGFGPSETEHVESVTHALDRQIRNSPEGVHGAIRRSLQSERRWVRHGIMVSRMAMRLAVLAASRNTMVTSPERLDLVAQW